MHQLMTSNPILKLYPVSDCLAHDKFMLVEPPVSHTKCRTQCRLEANLTILALENAMKCKQYLLNQGVFAYLTTVSRKVVSVKNFASKISRIAVAFLISASFTLSLVSTARAADANERVMENSLQLLNFISAVEPNGLPHIIESIENGSVRRLEPRYPVWIINSVDGTVLYYQGQETFKNQDATRLVDDKGFRFGERALAMARNSRSTWLTLALGGQEYKAFCASKAPFVVCSLKLN